MKFKQVTEYQNIGGKGRDCQERWNHIKEYLPEKNNCLCLDIGSAEGYFSKKIASSIQGRVISMEASELMIAKQKAFCKEEIDNKSVNLFTEPLTRENINQFTSVRYDLCLMLSVLHWMDDPDFILKQFSSISNTVIIELPELTDLNAWNQDFLRHIQGKFNSLENYITEISGRDILKEIFVKAHSSPFRRLFIL